MSTSRRFYVTTAIPYVNGDPHLGHALELVQADVLARHRRLRGDEVRFLRGTDDNALKNVAAADAAGVPVAKLVARRAEQFESLAAPLELSSDDFIRTSSDPRHRPGVERLWRACAAAGDLYERDYSGLYCGGCEAFLAEEDLVDGRCPEHGEPPEPVAERNWFFRLSRYRDTLVELLAGVELRIEPEQRRNEVLALVRHGLVDFSVSRPRGRARGWGIPVPGDPGQVVYVWFDALANYVTALGFGHDAEAYGYWWSGGDERIHVVGKGITRFHAVYWPAILLSAGEPLPTAIYVHDYLTVDGRKLSKSRGTAVDPLGLVERFGSDALRWFLLRDVPPNGDADVREDRIAARGNELADDLGNLVNRTIALTARNAVRDRSRARPPDDPDSAALERRREGLPPAIDEALAAFDLRSATTALWELVAAANRYVSASRPWELARPARSGDRGAGERFGAVLGLVLDVCDTIARELGPFLPAAAGRIESALADLDLAQGRALFRKSE